MTREYIQQAAARRITPLPEMRDVQWRAQVFRKSAGTILRSVRHLRFYCFGQHAILRFGKLEQIEQEGEWMKKCCVGCKWHEEWTWACFNGDSPYCADFVNCGCPLYEEKETNDKKGTDSL